MPGSSPNWVESISPTVSAASSRPPVRTAAVEQAREEAGVRPSGREAAALGQRGRTERVAVEERLAVRPEPRLAHDRGAARVGRVEAERGVHAERVEHRRAQILAERHLGRSLDEPPGERVAGVRVAPVGARRVDQGCVDRGAVGRQARAVRQQVAEREPVAHLLVELEEALLDGAHARGGSQRLRQRREREARPGTDRLVPARDAHAGVRLVDHPGSIDDAGGGTRHRSGVNPGAHEVERRSHRRRKVVDRGVFRLPPAGFANRLVRSWLVVSNRKDR